MFRIICVVALYSSMSILSLVGAAQETPASPRKLFKAIQKKDVESCREIIAHLTVEQINKRRDARYALVLAAVKGSVEITEMLLDAGADSSVRGISNKTPFQLAVLREHVDVAALFIERGEEIITLEEQEKAKLLIAAAKKGKNNLVKILLDAGVDSMARSTHGETALHCAAGRGNVDLATALIEREDDPERAMQLVNATTTDQRTPLHYAARSDRANMINLLCSVGANVEARDFNRRTPLCCAAEEGAFNAVLALCGYSANVNVRAVSNLTPLHFAARRGNANIADYLCNNGANPNLKSVGRKPIDFVVNSPDVFNVLRKYSDPSKSLLDRIKGFFTSQNKE